MKLIHKAIALNLIACSAFYSTAANSEPVDEASLSGLIPVSHQTLPQGVLLGCLLYTSPSPRDRG